MRETMDVKQNVECVKSTVLSRKLCISVRMLSNVQVSPTTEHVRTGKPTYKSPNMCKATYLQYPVDELFWN